MLSEAEVFFCEDTRVSKRLLHLLSERFQTRFQPDPHFISLHSHNERDRLEQIDAVLFERPCVYLSDAGMPGISDPGTALIRHCQQNRIDYTVLPGANAALVAVVDSGLGEGRFFFEGFLPHKSQARQERLKQLLAHTEPFVLYEAPTRIQMLAGELGTLAPLAQVVFHKELSKQHERRFIGTGASIARQLAEANLKGEWVAVIAPTQKAPEGWLIGALRELNAPKKPLAKILSRLDGQSTAFWYDRLTHKESP